MQLIFSSAGVFFQLLELFLEFREARHQFAFLLVL